MRRRAATILVVSVLLLTACASGETPDAPGPDALVDRETNSAKKEGAGDKSGAQKRRTPSGEDPGGASADAGGGAGDSGVEDRDGGTSTDRGSGARAGSGSGGTGGGSPYPAPGNYRFAQSGYEEFCDSAGRCDKEDLPSRQPVKLSYERRTNDSAVVVTEQEASDSRMARSWTKFTRSGAHITKMYVRFVYSGFRFERTYVPKPPVEAVRFPLTEGESWSGRWKASTSGSYSVRVGAPRRVEVGGRSVAAYPVDTTTKFRGDFEGRSRITAYIDAHSKSIVATDGVLNVTSQFGRYTTVFETRLVTGPGY